MRFGAKMSQISNSCVYIKLKESCILVGHKLGRFIRAKRMTLIAFLRFSTLVFKF